MSSRDSDSASRLSSALDEIFGEDRPRHPPDDDTDPTVEVPDPEARREPSTPTPGTPRPTPYVLPDIVPATADWSVDDESAETVAGSETNGPANDDAPVARRAPEEEPPTPTVTPPPAPRPTDTGVAPAFRSAPIATPAGAQLRSPGRRPRVRKVTRVLRHIDPWSTFKVAAIFSAVLYVVLLTAGVLLWRVAAETGTLDNVERWFTQFGWETFEFDGGAIYHNAWIIGLFGAVALTGALVLLATLFNLVSDIIGGIRMTVLEEEVVERTLSSTRRYVVRRPAARGDQSWDVDEGGSSRPPTSQVATAPVPEADWSVDDEPTAPVSRSDSSRDG